MFRQVYNSGTVTVTSGARITMWYHLDIPIVWKDTCYMQHSKTNTNSNFIKFHLMLLQFLLYDSNVNSNVQLKRKNIHVPVCVMFFFCIGASHFRFLTMCRYYYFCGTHLKTQASTEVALLLWVGLFSCRNARLRRLRVFLIRQIQYNSLYIAIKAVRLFFTDCYCFCIIFFLYRAHADEILI